MAAKEFCYPCEEGGKCIVALRYCSDCEEHLCEDCSESHLRVKAFTFHHLVDVSSTGPIIPFTPSMRCEIHTDNQIDFYCSHHDSVCCRACIPRRHSSCEQVLPLDVASKNVRQSTLVEDASGEFKRISETIAKILINRDININSLVQSKYSIKKQIRGVKGKIIKHLDELEQNLIAELVYVEEKYISTMKTTKTEISELDAIMKAKMDELEILKNHGSNNQLFLALHKHIACTRQTDVKLHEIASSIKETDIKFEGNTNLEFKSLGSITEINRPCNITYTTYKSQQAQVQPDTVKSLTEFKRDDEVKLVYRDQYNLRGISVTAENKLLICNFQPSCPKVYIYKDCQTFESEFTCSSPPYDVAVIPCSHTAVVTLPDENSVQFINTAKHTQEKKAWIRERCLGVTATKERIYLGGLGQILILGIDGSEITTITTHFWFDSLRCDANKDHLLIRQDGILRCIDLNGKCVYRYPISGSNGAVVDRNGDVYISGYDSNQIHRLSSDGTIRDIVLKQSDGIKRPTFLLFNHDFTKLFVVSNKKSVLIYNCR